MIPIPRREHKLLIAIHGWSGVSLGLLLLVIVATGTVAVWGEEIGLWSSGALETRSPLVRPLDANVRRVFAEEHGERFKRIDLSASAANRLRILLRGDPGPQERGVSVEVGPDGKVVHRFEGLMRDIGDADPAGALSSFLVNTHVRLYVPEPWGYILTGVAGLAMMVACLSGLVIHRHLLADIFTLRTQARRSLAERDRHSVAGAWVLPFGLLLAFTGSFLSFAGSIGFPALAWVSFGGDQQKLIAAVIGDPPPSDPKPATGADLDRILADALVRAGMGPDYVSIAGPGRADTRITVYPETRDGEITAPTLIYEGVNGSFIAEKPGIGRVPSAGGTAYSLMAPLHFGNFAGLASKLVWAALGFATCFVIVSGLRLWLARRDLSHPAWAALDRATSLAAFGLPLATGTAGIAFFLSLPSGSTVTWTTVGFLAGVAASIEAAIIMSRPALDRALRTGAGLTLALLPLLRLDEGGPSWSAAIAAGQGLIPGGDIAVLLIGVAFLAEPYRAWMRARRGVPDLTLRSAGLE